MDIDHLYLMSYNYKKGEDGKLTNKFDSQTEAKKYHLNMIMDCMMTLLKDTENSTHSLYKSIDNDTDLAKNVADKIPVFGSNKHKAFNFGALTEQVERKNDYITGKKGIGPFALNVTNLILTYLYNIQFKDTKFCKETGIWKLDHLEDWDDNSIQAWLSAFINGHVDIVKDPWVSKLNVNPFTYNMLNLLLRSGFGEVALWFLSQPIIKDMAAASDNAQSQFLRDQYKDGSVWKAREKAVLEAVKKYVPESKLTPEYINEFLNEKDPTRRINAVNFLKENVDLLERIATGKEIPDEQDAQEMVFFAWKALEKYAAALGAFVQHSKIDTRKHGKSLIEIANYMDGYNKIFHPEGADRQSSLWDLDSLDHFARHSWLEQKTKAAISWPFRILHGLTFNGNESFMKMCISICRTLVGKNGTISTDLLQLISRHMQTKIKSKYFLDYARNYLQISDEDITGLFVGDFTIAKRLNNLKYAIQHFEQYNRLANNRLLNQIMPVNLSEPITVTNENKELDTIERSQFITVLDNVDSSRINSDDLIDGWVDLLNDSDKNVKKFARDLIVYAFLTSGEFKGWNKLFKYVPPQWLRGQIDTDFKPYSKFVKEELLSTFASSEDDIDEIVSNNDTDFKIVKTMKDEDEDGNKNFVAKTHLVLIGRQRTKKEDIDELPVYISVDNPMESNRNRNGKNLFKLVDMYHGYPIYMRMRHKGYHYGNTDIYEYGWTFEYLENGLRQSRLTDYQSMYEKAQRYIDSLDNYAVDEFELNPEEMAGAIIKATLYSEDNTVEADQILTPQEIAEQEMPNEEGEYDWEYLEDSIDTGLLDQPASESKYGNFGRVRISSSDRPYVRERVNLVDKNGNKYPNMTRKLSDLISKFSQLSNINGNVTIKYADWKQLLQIPTKINDSDDTTNQFEYFVDHELRNYYEDWLGYNPSDLHGEYNKQTKELTLNAEFYNAVKLLHDNIDVLKFFIGSNSDLSEGFMRVLDNSEDLYDFFLNAQDEEFDIPGGFNVTPLYTYTDYRQLDVFLDNPILRESQNSTSNEHEQC